MNELVFAASVLDGHRAEALRRENELLLRVRERRQGAAALPAAALPAEAAPSARPRAAGGDRKSRPRHA
ncbi:hypothetical protein [Microbacterium immunditiarum]|uniref:Uncharacterized protein n=1 Tax=Microbacterium immunditiarum TaxID=337480 RepID=A0A7Y9GR90_9MICO|nr:hypothetical protein [Microbacterium immunditiarum]NYE21225.1 hypothetical protein [Microbacterium immunditiarum]